MVERRLRIALVAPAAAPVRRDSTGSIEQLLWQLERGHAGPRPRRDPVRDRGLRNTCARARTTTPAGTTRTTGRGNGSWPNACTSATPSPTRAATTSFTATRPTASRSPPRGTPDDLHSPRRAGAGGGRRLTCACPTCMSCVRPHIRPRRCRRTLACDCHPSRHTRGRFPFGRPGRIPALPRPDDRRQGPAAGRGDRPARRLPARARRRRRRRRRRARCWRRSTARCALRRPGRAARAQSPAGRRRRASVSAASIPSRSVW